METLTSPPAKNLERNPAIASSVSVPHCSALTQNVNSATRVQELRSQLEKGVYLLPSTRQAVELCQKHGISLPTAYRHIRAKTVPTTSRRTGRDGKSYPAGRGVAACGFTEKNLRLALRALRRVCHHAEAEGFGRYEELLEQIANVVDSLRGRAQRRAA